MRETVLEADQGLEIRGGPGTMRLCPVVLKGVTFFFFSCPACRCNHVFEVRNDGGQPTWRFNGDLEFPTFTPALRNGTRGCHLSLQDGVIHYLPSSLHEYRGMRMMLPVFTEQDRSGPA